MDQRIFLDAIFELGERYWITIAWRKAAPDATAEEKPLSGIGKTLEDKTKRQQNPHPQGTLDWLSWIAARLGDWNCYYKKPDLKTMATGWRQLAAMISGFVIAGSALAVYGIDV